MFVTIKNDNSLKYIKKLKKNNKKPFIDAVITDPPYCISRENNFKTIGRNGIDFGDWDYGFDQTKWIEEIYELIKDGGSIIIFNDYKNMGDIAKTFKKLGIQTKDLLRWEKKNPMPRNMDRRYVTDFEFAIWGVKGKEKWCFNKLNSAIPYMRPKFLHSIATNGKNKIHPTQKPIKLLEDIIKIHTNEGDIIFDPFMGSGSTGIASIQLNRIFIGAEINPKYFMKASKWISEIHAKNINNKKVNRSPLYYLGDKYKLLPQIYSFFPKNINNFYDVFGGGGTILASIVAKKYFYNDIDKNITMLVKHLKNTSFQKIISKIRKIIDHYKLSYWRNNRLKKDDKQKYTKLRSDYNKLINKKDGKSLIMLLVLLIYGFNSQIRFNSKNKFNIPIGKQNLNQNREKILKIFINSIKNKEISFKSKNFDLFLEEIKFKKNDFVYLDPPYSITNATYNSKWKSKDDQKLFKILDELDEKGVKWAMSNVLTSGSKENKKLIKWSKKYYIHHLEHNYNNSNYQKKENGAEEVLIYNYIQNKES